MMRLVSVLIQTRQIKKGPMATAVWRRPQTKIEQPSRTNWPLFILSGPLLILLVVPLLAIVMKTAPATIWQALGEETTRQAISLSLRTSTTTAVLVLIFGTPLAYLLGRRRLRVAPLLEIVIDLPTVLPPAVAGLALLMAFGRRGLLGGTLDALGMQIPFTTLAVVMAQTFVAAPYYVKTATVGLSGVSRELEQAAGLDGATLWETFRHVLLPLAWRSIIGGVTLCWARALGEFGATIIFAGNLPGRTQTMPLAVYLGFEIDMDQALTLAAILLAVSFGVLFVVRAALRGQAPD
jgi:molybdate transport system permease protein